MKKLFAVLLALSLALPFTAGWAEGSMAGMAGVDVKPSPPAALITATDTPPAAVGSASTDTPAGESGLSMDEALKILNEAISLDDFAAQAEMILDVAARVGGSGSSRANVLINCSRLLFYLDTEDRYGAECESLLLEALDFAAGDQRTLALQMLAEQFNYAGRAKEAVPVIEKELAERPNDEQLKIVLGSTLYYAGRIDDALDMLGSVLEDSPQNITAALLRAEVLTGAYRFAEAITAYRQIADQNPDRLDGLYGLYMTYEAAGEFERAARIIDELIQYGGEYDLWLKRAQLRLWSQYMPEDALAEADALIRADPEWVDAYVIKLGAYLLLEQYDEAQKTADAIAPLDAGYAELLRGIIAMNDNRWADAEAQFAKALEKSPDLYLVWQNKAEARLNGFSDPEGAMEALAYGFEATEGTGTPTLFWELGVAYQRQGKLLEAARAFAAGDALTFEDSLPLYSLVSVLLDAGREKDALDMLAEMEMCYPGWYDTMAMRVVVEDILGNADEALAAFDALTEKYPYMTEKLADWEGMLRATVGDPGGAEMIRAWIDGKGTDAESDQWASYAYALMKLGDAEAAWAALETAEGLLDGVDAQTHYLAMAGIQIALVRAELLMNAGDTAGCVAALEAAASLGWQPASLTLQPVFAAVCKTNGFQALLKKYGELDGAWDLSPLPGIPEIAETTAKP